MQANYPATEIVLAYTVLGSFIGGVIVSLSGIIEQLIQHGINGQTLDMIGSIFLVGFYGIPFGFLPAFLTGLCIIYKRYYFNTLQVYIKIFSIGFIVSLIFYIMVTLLLIIFSSSGNSSDIAEILDLTNWLLALVGGLSSVIVGFLCLPKSYDKNTI